MFIAKTGKEEFFARTNRALKVNVGDIPSNQVN